ncbi:glycosyltransferase family 4 protein [Burkholderia vietnamiensis]|uniref:glycosyltransferase family 4 protein n=1 Tax=Burkholderia vietnamiensis TaxID=60552 RepID=UPI0009BE0360|nr:glycosyltransferase family 4 protein [Burkholderia vietnamiensis]
MRILHIVLTPRHSGAEILACSLADAHAGRGAVTGIAALNPSDPDFEKIVDPLVQRGVWYTSPPHVTGRLDRLRLIKRACREFKPDIIVAHSVIPAAYARAVASLSGASIPVVSVLHSATNDDYSNPALRASEYLLRFAAAAVVTVTDTARDNYRMRFGSAGRIETIPNGTQIDRFRFNPAERHRLRHALKVGEKQIVLLQVGRVARVKGQVSSVLALQRLVSGGHDVALWFAGLTETDEYRQEVVEKIAKLKLEHHVLWLGSRSDVPSLLSAADVYLMPSLREAHSVAMIEALASSVPVVASDIDAFAKLSRFEGVRCVPVSDSASYAAAIESFIKYQPRFERDLSAFSVKRVAERYFDLFKQILMRDDFGTERA